VHLDSSSCSVAMRSLAGKIDTIYRSYRKNANSVFCRMYRADTMEFVAGRLPSEREYSVSSVGYTRVSMWDKVKGDLVP